MADQVTTQDDGATTGDTPASDSQTGDSPTGGTPTIDTTRDDTTEPAGVDADGGATDGDANVPGRKARRQAEKAERKHLPRRQRLLHYARRHRVLSAIALVLLPLFLLVGYSWIKAMTKEGSESFQARNTEWARDMHLGFLVDWTEQKYYAQEQPKLGGTPDPAMIGPAQTTSAPNTEASSGPSTAPKPTVPHLAPPSKMSTPAATPVTGEGEWSPVGPLIGGFPGMYTTKVRPNNEVTSLLVLVAWIDPKLTSIKIHPGTELPGGKWSTPPLIPAEECATAIMGANGGFRMDASRGGYWGEGHAQLPLRDGAASLVQFKDGTATVAQWGREVGPADFDRIDVVRQNLELMVDNGEIPPAVDTGNWGALLPNSYFVWRSGYGVTKDGALLYIGGPGLKPHDIADLAVRAGAVRFMEGDINPEWVTANLYSVGADGKCHGTKGLDGPEDKGGMRAPADRYLKTDTRDFVVVSTRPIPG